MTLILHGYWRSSASWRVRIALHHKELAFEYRPVSLLADQQLGDAYRGLNPMEQVPTLEIEGRRVTQSLAILQLLDQLHPARPLLPADPWERATAWELAEIVNSGIQPLQNTSVVRKLKAAGLDDRAWAASFIAKGLGAFEARAVRTAGTYSVGDIVTVADCCIVPQLYQSRRFDVDLAPYPTLLRIEAACAGLPAFRAAHAENQIDAVRST